MANKLYKVNVEIDVFVMADGLGDAAKIAKMYAGGEVAEFGLAHASEVNSVYEVPEDWKNVMPYSEKAQEKRTCSVIMKAAKASPQDPKQEVKEPPTPVVEVKVSKKEPEPEEELPVELPKNNDFPQLRFKI